MAPEKSDKMAFWNDYGKIGRNRVSFLIQLLYLIAFLTVWTPSANRIMFKTKT
jgi:hypothetical protein